MSGHHGSLAAGELPGPVDQKPLNLPLDHSGWKGRWWKKILKYLGTESNHHLALTKHADVVYKKGPTADITPEEAEKF